MTRYFPRELIDLAVGNDKTLVTDSERIGLVIESIAITYTATAGVGTRAIDAVLLNENDVELQRLVGILDNTASQVKFQYLFPGAGAGFEFAPFVLRPGFKIQIVDTADIDVLDTCAVVAYFAGTEVAG